jgi:hypothetical protein
MICRRRLPPFMNEVPSSLARQAGRQAGRQNDRTRRRRASTSAIRDHHDAHVVMGAATVGLALAQLHRVNAAATSSARAAAPVVCAAHSNHAAVGTCISPAGISPAGQRREDRGSASRAGRTFLRRHCASGRLLLGHHRQLPTFACPTRPARLGHLRQRVARTPPCMDRRQATENRRHRVLGGSLKSGVPAEPAQGPPQWRPPAVWPATIACLISSRSRTSIKSASAVHGPARLGESPGGRIG